MTGFTGSAEELAAAWWGGAAKELQTGGKKIAQSSVKAVEILVISDSPLFPCRTMAARGVMPRPQTFLQIAKPGQRIENSQVRPKKFFRLRKWATRGESQRTAPPSNVLTLTRPCLVPFNSGPYPEFFQLCRAQGVLYRTVELGQAIRGVDGIRAQLRKDRRPDRPRCAPVLPS
jgi:hypothetical protein